MNIQDLREHKWTYCNECKEHKNSVVEIENFDEGVTVWICKECLEKALTLINKEIENA